MVSKTIYRLGCSVLLVSLSIQLHIIIFGQDTANEFKNRSLVDENLNDVLIAKAGALNNISWVYLQLGQTAKALDALDQALLIQERIGYEPGTAKSLNNFGKAYFYIGDDQKALFYFEKALPLLRKVGDIIGEARTLHNLMLVNDSLKKPELAIVYGKRSVNAYQEIRSKMSGLDRKTQRIYERSIAETYRKLANILISEGRLPEARAVLDLIKEEEYRDWARSGEDGWTVPYSKMETDVVAKIDRLADLGREENELQALKKQLREAFPSDKQERLDRLTGDIKTANAEFDNALSELSKADPSVESRTLEIKGEKNLQSALQNLGRDMNTGVVALYTVIGTEEVKDAGDLVKHKTRSKFGWVILVTSKDRKAYPIDVNDLESNVFDLRTALSSARYDPGPLAKKIYNAIFRQTSDKQKVTLEADLAEILGKYPDKTIMWSLDGVLRYIPMAALHDGSGYLVEKYRNIVFTKESLLWLMNQPKRDAQTLGLGVSAGNRELNLDALPGVEAELAQIVRQKDEKTGIVAGTRKLNAEFKKQEILDLKDDDNPFQIVHIASHYSFNPSDQSASYLLAGDGKLTFAEMNKENNLFGTVDLLTLSACDTGMSGNGKEAEGFAYLAQSLGAKSVIASLWRVSDAGTPELMVRFYRLLAENPTMAKGEAFRRAQLSLLTGADPGKTPGPGSMLAEPVRKASTAANLPLFVKDDKKPFAHPYYWAPFVLIGNWR